MRKPLLFVLLITILLGLAVPVTGNSDIRITINGQPWALDVPPVLIEGRTLVPVRAVFEALGAAVEWDGTTRTVTGRLGGYVIGLQIGASQGLVNGRHVDLDVPARIIDGRTMVPIRFIGESLGARVAWDGATRTVAITAAGPVQKPKLAGAPGPGSREWKTKPVACDGGLFDTHAHTGAEGWGQANLTIPALAARMQENDVRCSVLFVVTTRAEQEFDELRSDLSGVEVGFVPFLQPIPVFPYTPDDIKRILTARQGVFAGIGEIPFYMGVMLGTSIKAEPWPTLFTYAGQNNLVMMLHPNRWQVNELAEMLALYPNTKVMVHGPELVLTGDQLVRLLRERPNLYFTMDVTTLMDARPVRERNAADFIRWYDANQAEPLARGLQYLPPLLEAAPDRVMWGTDVGSAWNVEPEAYRRMVEFTRALIDALPPQHRKPYAFENARRLFGNGIVFAVSGP